MTARAKKRARRARHRAVAVVLALMLSHSIVAVLGYLLASSDHPRGQTSDNPSAPSLDKTHDASTASLLSRYEHQLFQQTQQLVMARKTNETLRETHKALLEQHDEVSKELELFRRVVKGQDETQGLALGRLTLEAVSDHAYGLSVDVLQMSGFTRVRGQLHITIEGYPSRQHSVLTTLPLHLGQTANDRAAALDFANFQTVQSVVRLPAQFRPQYIHVEARFTEGKQARVSKRYDWAPNSMIVK